jgi:hypothetical protein
LTVLPVSIEDLNVARLDQVLATLDGVLAELRPLAGLDLELDGKLARAEHLVAELHDDRAALVDTLRQRNRAWNRARSMTTRSPTIGPHRHGVRPSGARLGWWRSHH